MSNTNDANVTAIPTPEKVETPAVEKQSFVQRGVAFVKSHKKPAIAVGIFVGLVGAAALTGRKDEPSAPEEETFSPEDQAAFDAFVNYDSATEEN